MTISALERCVGDIRRFADEFWGRAPLLHQGGAAVFDGLLDIGDVDRLVTETLLRMPAFRLVRDGTPLDPNTYTQTIRIGGRAVERTARSDRVLDEFAAGATIVLQALHRQSGPVARFCRQLELDLTHPVQANAYVTPPSAQGFSVHHDTHDVFVAQTEGHKAWRVYRPLIPLAGSSQPWKSSLGDPGEPILEVELGPGDCLYLPRGFPHDAEAREEVSIHVTVGILSFTWLDVWREVMRRAPEEERFREPLPVGFAADPSSLAPELDVRRKELQGWLDVAGGEDAMESFAERFWSNRRPFRQGGLEGLSSLDRIGADTLLRRRPESVFRVERMGDRVRVNLGQREVRLPPFCEPALRLIATGDTFVAADLPDLDDEKSRLVLVRRLVREGALEVVRDAG
jgi:hypothetical protein